MRMGSLQTKAQREELQAACDRASVIAFGYFATMGGVVTRLPSSAVNDELFRMVCRHMDHVAETVTALTDSVAECGVTWDAEPPDDLREELVEVLTRMEAHARRLGMFDLCKDMSDSIAAVITALH